MPRNKMYSTNLDTERSESVYEFKDRLSRKGACKLDLDYSNSVFISDERETVE